MIQDSGVTGEMPLRHLEERSTTMKLKALSLSLGLVLLVMNQVSAHAADWNYGAGGLKDGSYAASVAVPAPAPIPVYHADYYFRADAGLGMGDKPTSTQRGLVFGTDSDTGPFGVQAPWFDNDFESFVTLGVGAGVYWNNNFRTDITAETRSQGRVKINGVYNYQVTNGGNTTNVQGTVRDETTLRGGIFLANAYYDFDRFVGYSSFRPYVGLGVGFAWNELKRNHSTTELACTPAPCTPVAVRATTTEQDKTHTVTMAAAVTTGFTYKISHNTALDMNYRFLYIDGTRSGLGINGATFGGGSVVEIGESYQHQIRAGIRYDIN